MDQPVDGPVRGAFLDGGEEKPVGPDALLGAAVDDSAIAKATSAISRTRLIAIGNSGFATNAFVNQLAGGSLITRAIGWLAQAEELATISFRPTDRSRVYLSKSDATTVRAVAYGLCPAFFALIGVSLLISRLREDRRARAPTLKAACPRWAPVQSLSGRGG